MKIPFLSGLKVNGKVELNNLSLLSTPTKILTIDESNNITYSTSVGGSVDLSNYYNKTQTDTNISNAIANLVSSAPTTLDTLNELAAALGNDPNFATTVTNLIGTKANSSDVYLKSASDARYKAITWLPTWNDVQSRPTNLSHFTNDLGLNSIYQPLENQRLSSSNNVVFNQITANTKLSIPSTSTNKYSLYVDENGIGGTGSSIPIISYLNDLSDVIINAPTSGNVLMYNGSEWINSTVTSGTFDYNQLINKPTHLSQFTNDLGNYGNWVNKSQTDTYYYSISNPSGFITAASLPDLSPYALANGSNATGTWGINIGGSAAKLDGMTADFQYTHSSDLFRMVGQKNNGDGKLYRFTPEGVKLFLGIGNGSTLNNNITGNAGSVTNGIYSTGSYSNPSWLTALAYSKLSGVPTLLSQFTNDLGLGSIFQPLENQRLSSSNNVTFNQIIANSKLSIPSTSSNKYSIYIDENGLGGGSTPIPIVAALNDLNDVTISSPVNGNVLTYNGSQWVNSTITSGTFDYNALYNRPDLSVFAFANGSNSSGTWGINISGYAEKLKGYNNVNNIYFDWTGSKLALKVDNTDFGDVLPTNISGNAAKWGNITSFADGSVIGSDLAYILGTHANGYAYRFNQTAIKTWLGLGSLAYLNSLSGAQINTDISIPNNDIGIAQILRWKNYGSGHVIFDASNGTAPNGTAIDSTNAQVNWVASYPTLMGWNGTNTFGVRVDSARNADRWGGQIYQIGGSLSDFTDLITYSPTNGYWSNTSVSDLKTSLAISLQNVTDVGNSTTNALSAQRLIAGYDSGVAGSVNTNNYLRVSGNGGIWWASHAVALEGLGGSTIQLGTNNSDVNFRLASSGVLRGSLYADSSNNIGFLNSSSGWSFRVDYNGWAFATSFSCDGWFRSSGATGWYNSTYQGGIYMEDSTWVRTYNDRGFFVSGSIGILASGIIKAGAGQGFQNLEYVAGRNRIWSFGNADNYGLSYHQGTSSIYGNDGIGIHFGDANNPQFNFLYNGLFYAPTVRATNSIQIPAKNTSGVNTGNHFSIWVEV